MKITKELLTASHLKSGKKELTGAFSLKIGSCRNANEPMKN